MIAGFGRNDQFWSQNDHNVTFSIFQVDICVQRIEIHGIVYKDRYILEIYFRHFIYSIEFSFALCIAQTLIKFKNISYMYSMLSNPLVVECPGGAAKIRGK